MNERQADTGKTIQSIETMIRLLDVIRRRESVGVTELANEVGRSKSTVHHYLRTLELYDCLEKSDGTYQLGLRFLTYGGQARFRQRIYQLAKSDVDQLAAETGEQVRLVVERGGHGIAIYQAEGEHLDYPRSYVGSVDELHCTAAGKAFLAALSPDRVAELLAETELVGYTENTITDKDVLLEELEQIRSREVAYDDEERTEGIRCVAVAITSRSGELLGAISVSGPTDRLTDERFRSKIPSQLQNIVGVVEINTTYSDWADTV
ncbi:IclR family transcriptional regulator [Halostagnicola sp. A-GB9-2]|uniref:IclR family transcriptional regulator n=1 Tax=Halostagnicola sp. A-GB9-2 TaxID=3048066 RepID=UPI0024C0884E|nr:IclR family transcriptional regulator [Halostagnicola sp. A-GB9-2]MDJ1434628.1 IclR family transcriptional regulator [Halostagnicola sp. A-GB9-2]